MVAVRHGPAWQPAASGFSGVIWSFVKSHIMMHLSPPVTSEDVRAGETKEVEQFQRPLEQWGLLALEFINEQKKKKKKKTVSDLRVYQSPRDSAILVRGVRNKAKINPFQLLKKKWQEYKL